MKAVKGILFVLSGLFIMITLFSLLMPSRVMMVRTQPVMAPRDSVFKKIADLSVWTSWHPVFKQPDWKGTFSNPSAGSGATATWNSGGKENKLEITSDSAYVLQATLSRGNENPVSYIISVLPMNNPREVQVEWKAVIKLKWYPWEKFSGMLIDKMTGPGYEEALRGLRDVSEMKP